MGNVGTNGPVGVFNIHSKISSCENLWIIHGLFCMFMLSYMVLLGRIAALACAFVCVCVRPSTTFTNVVQRDDGMAKQRDHHILLQIAKAKWLAASALIYNIRAQLKLHCRFHRFDRCFGICAAWPLINSVSFNNLLTGFGAKWNLCMSKQWTMNSAPSMQSSH